MNTVDTHMKDSATVGCEAAEKQCRVLIFYCTVPFLLRCKPRKFCAAVGARRAVLDINCFSSFASAKI